MASRTSLLSVVLLTGLGTLVACGSSDENEPPGAGAGQAGSGGRPAGGGSTSTGGKAGSASAGTSNNSGGSTNVGGTSDPQPGTPGQIGGCDVFTPDDEWNKSVADATPNAEWTQRLHQFVGDALIHPDYGMDSDGLYGIPINVVPENQPPLGITFEYAEDESDPGPYPFPGPDAVKIEGGTARNCRGDCHVLALQQGVCKLFEGYACSYQDDGWHCGNGAVWDLKKNSYGQRPKGWTSADAAGLSITAGLLRYDEVRAGKVPHAIRFTTRCTRNNFVKPATHRAVPEDCLPSDPQFENFPPMGLRVRLRKGFDISKFPQSTRVILTAMQTYGMILADNGSDFYFQGEAHTGWTEDDIEPLKDIAATEFEAVEVPPLEP